MPLPSTSELKEVVGAINSMSAQLKQVFTTLDEEHPIEDTLKVLEGAAGFLRHELAKRMQLRIVPHVHFKYDESIAYGNDLSALINKAMGMENPENRMSDNDDEDQNHGPKDE